VLAILSKTLYIFGCPVKILPRLLGALLGLHHREPLLRLDLLGLDLLGLDLLGRP
jgi:hypothetical protein